jgi:peptidoglycan/LPS O-acetylase OafA/YrhL
MPQRYSLIAHRNDMGLGSEKHIDSLDGLRGIAILLVFLFHYLPRNAHNPLSWLASLGWTGVDLFFVLSGFLITGILYDTRRASNFITAFYARRALRLLPAYLLAVGLVLFVAFICRVPTSWKAIPFFIYGANIMLPLKDGAPDFSPYFSCTHFWSLALEEQFYSLWPLVVLFVPRRRALIKICVGGIFGALLFRLTLTHLGASTWLLYAELPARMDALLVGGILALVLRGSRKELFLGRMVVYPLMGSCCLVLIVLFARVRSLYFTSSAMTSWGYSVIAGVYACVLARALVPGTLVSRIGRTPVLRFFGKYSYGLYIWHQLPSPIFILWQPWFTRTIHPLLLGQVVYATVMLGLSTAMALLSYRFLELPFLRLKSRFRYQAPTGEPANLPHVEAGFVRDSG